MIQTEKCLFSKMDYVRCKFWTINFYIYNDFSYFSDYVKYRVFSQDDADNKAILDT